MTNNLEPINMNQLNQNNLNKLSQYDEDLDIEIEEEFTLSEPLDRTSISIGTRLMTVKDILNRLEENKLIAPEFQRNKNIWTKTAKSRLIESLLLQIPLPAFYIDATNDEQWFVIDGMQRITTFQQFVNEQSFTLNGLDFFTDLHGKNYQQLLPRWQRRITETKLTIHLILRGTSSEISFNIFRRINRGGMPISSQEMRYAKNSSSKITKLLKELSLSQEFKQATDNNIDDKRMIAQECILKVLCLIHSDLENVSFQDYDYFLDQKMTELNQLNENKIEALKQRFLHIMKIAYSLFNYKFDNQNKEVNQTFRKPSSQEHRRYPINKALLEAWSVNIDQLNPEQINILKQKKEDLYKILLQEQEKGDFDSILYRSAGDSHQVKKRFKHIQGIIKRILL